MLSFPGVGEDVFVWFDSRVVWNGGDKGSALLSYQPISRGWARLGLQVRGSDRLLCLQRRSICQSHL